MTIKPSPRGSFYIAKHGQYVVFDRDRGVAIARLRRLIAGRRHG
jgi:hypothetical protein